jgi:hypothetical protein
MSWDWQQEKEVKYVFLLTLLRIYFFKFIFRHTVKNIRDLRTIFFFVGERPAFLFQ